MMIEREDRYDRQLRLWANAGQKRLEDSLICLINANAMGTEVLKNLVLPGIGNFVLIDDKVATSEDVSSNFFLVPNDEGKNIASAATHKLRELNDAVEGFAIDQSLGSLLENEDYSFWENFNVVTVSGLVQRTHVEKLKSILWEKNIPLLLIDSIGFYGSLRLISRETTVIETHSSANFYDLRIDTPWEELQKYSDSIDLEKLDVIDHSQVPYVIIFIKALQYWKSMHNGKAPVSFDEKKLFRSLIESLARDLTTESNFIDASKTMHRALQRTQIPQSVKNLFNDKCISEEQINASTPIFWIFIVALKNFVSRNGTLPLPGNIPDMSSATKSYINLQNIYREKARADERDFTDEVVKVLTSIGRSPQEISKDSIHTFCKNSYFIHVSRGSRKDFNQEMVKTVLKEMPETEDNSILEIYFAIITFNSFFDNFGRCPQVADYEDFVKEFRFLCSLGPKTKIPKDLDMLFKEILSHSSLSYHNINSFIAGVASQEILKLSTGQYTPVDNLFVFDGVHSTSSKWKI